MMNMKIVKDMKIMIHVLNVVRVLHAINICHVVHVTYVIQKIVLKMNLFVIIKGFCATWPHGKIWSAPKGKKSTPN